jgi:group II intron reverse transcriptase/maturase
MSREYDITRAEVEDAWKCVRKAGGASGADRISIADIDKNLDNELYKIWNRMSSGSYMAQPVLLINIPKAKGGYRQLGIPTVTDRIAQTIIKKRLEKILDKEFHEDSYGYRPHKSAIDAVTVCRERCFRHEWLVEIDISKFFDNLDHEIVMDKVSKYTNDKLVMLYAKRFLKAKGVREGDKEELIRDKGTPQGGVVSPILANLYLHEAFDSWMEQEYRSIKFERYADDVVIHCVSERQAQFMKEKIQQRLKEYKLDLNLGKTNIVYTGVSNKHDKRKHDLRRKFTFLGYDFKPRLLKDKIVFSPGMGAGALKKVQNRLRELKLGRRVSASVEDIAKLLNPIVRGWINYYGHHRRSELYRMSYYVNNNLAKFIKKKHKTYSTWEKAWKELMRLKRLRKTLFSHWFMIVPQERRAV